MHCSKIRQINAIFIYSISVVALCIVFLCSIHFPTIAEATLKTNVVPAGVEDSIKTTLKSYMGGVNIADGFVINKIDLTQFQIIIVLKKDQLITKLVIEHPSNGPKEGYKTRYLAIHFEGSTEGHKAAEILANALDKSGFNPWIMNRGRISKADPKLLKQYLEYQPVKPYATIFLALCTLILVILLLKTFRKHPKTASFILIVTSFFTSVFLCETIMFVLSSDTPYMKLGNDCFPTNPDGYFKEVTIEDHPEIKVWCSWSENKPVKECETKDKDNRQYKTKILALGDSFTEGLGVFIGDQWPSILSDMLKERPSTKVINCGRSGMDTAGVIQRYNEFGDNHHPDIVVYAYVLNDGPLIPMDIASYADISFYGSSNGYDYSDSNSLQKYSALIRFLITRQKQKEIAEKTEEMYQLSFADTNEDLPQYFKSIVDFDKMLAKKNIKLLIAIFPLFYKFDDYPFAGIHQKIRNEFEKNQIEYIDLFETYKNMDDAKLAAHPLDLHPNKLAHKLAAEAIYKKLKSLSWL